ncbi:nuclease-related domain-containing DEAD/DEAH box helicase [Archangium primigenium]|uniref:ATP-binding domain-containing protein n=1 Tax=[Archangium] primigenium TaxID=2792470 RepID=UPI00195735AD|nr:nuclease-related domain-containing DEAD/DEAH box helicase [Archangium primigenium]MBM7115746.1 ATP-binding domain-containing protein [Archangium primigenium]
MAQMIPQRTEAQLDEPHSRAEARFYRACRDHLDPRLLVFHSVCFLRQSSMRAPVDGEADFVIFDPQGGFLVVEVKGGGILRDRQVDQWYSTNEAGHRNEIHDPIWQARTEKHAILEQLLKHPRWLGSNDRILAGHAVFFPDVGDVRPFVCPELAPEMVGGREQLKGLQAWYDRVTGYWTGQDTRFRPLGTDGLDVVKKLFSDPVEARALMAVQLEDEERRRIRLTDEQSRLLRSLGARKQARICGGAGTGKTVLALEQARRLAREGRRTLLLCLNRPLAEYLKATASDVPGLLPMNYHQLCDWAVRDIERRTGQNLLEEARSANPGADDFATNYPYALALAAGEWQETFDAIIVDEGQDFGSDYWLPLEMLLEHSKDPVFMVFYDQNQAVYQRLQKCPIKEEPFVLTRNCRNTRYIHEAAYRYFHGDPTDPCEIDGAPLETMLADRPQEQAAHIHQKVSQLLREHRVSPEEIVILVADNKAKRTYYDLLKHRLLPNGVKWTEEVHRTKNTVLMDTVHRYKGLEAGVLFVWGLDELDPRNDREVIYVAFSRAKSRLYLVGREVSCRTLMAPTLS